MTTYKHIILYSGGVGSYISAKRVVQKYGNKNVILLFCDTSSEDPDLYRFLKESSEFLNCQLVWLKDGRDLWQVFDDEKLIGNSFADPCSKILKRKPGRKWIQDNFNRFEAYVYIGIDWSEEHRYKQAKPLWEPYQLRAPLCESPYLLKAQMYDELEKDGIALPNLYKEGFQHNNCNGFCVKAGKGHFKLLLEKRPDVYRFHEEKELEFREKYKKNYTVIYEYKNKKKIPVTMREFRERIEAGTISREEELDIGGCGCMLD